MQTYKHLSILKLERFAKNHSSFLRIQDKLFDSIFINISSVIYLKPITFIILGCMSLQSLKLNRMTHLN